jgi:hypothetical protein
MASHHSESEKKSYVMAEDEAERLHNRGSSYIRHSHMNVLKNVQEIKDDLGNKEKKFQQAMYLHPVGKIPDFDTLPSSREYNSEIVEQYLENAILYENIAQLVHKREDFALIEDDFGLALEKIMKDGKKPSFQNLKEACSKYDKEEDIGIHSTKSNKTYWYFMDRGIPEDDAKAYAFAIAFYTGKYSWTLSKAANCTIRRLGKQDQMYADNAQFDSKTAMIMYYLIKGLSHIDFYWGTVVRYVQLTEKDLQDYKPGEIVTWLQFSSADKGGKNMPWPEERNTVFTISSLTGRSIRCFSNCNQEEDEVLFLPHSSFIVCHVAYDGERRKNQIYLRQVQPFFHYVANEYILI